MRGIVRLLLGQGGRQLGIGAVIALPLLLADRDRVLEVLPDRDRAGSDDRRAGGGDDRERRARGDVSPDASSAGGVAAAGTVGGYVNPSEIWLAFVILEPSGEGS